MIITSWNCGGKFREKFNAILKTDSDIYVIQECENPAESTSAKYRDFADNYIWTGENKNKGLGIFAKSHIHLIDNEWDKFCLRNFLSVRVNEKFDLVAVWACRPYIEEYYIYQSINITNFNHSTVIIGDFNSNAIWDRKNDTRTHRAVVQQLQNIGLCSAYHHTYCEQQGKETKNTFYLYRNIDKGYHIDHCFAAAENIRTYKVLDDMNWLNLSDHVPISIDFSDNI